jgi:uncharacterized membrane protein
MSTKQTQEKAPEHVGQVVTIDGITFDVPLSIEVAGAEAVEELVAKECAKHGIRVVRIEDAPDIYVPRAISANGDEAVDQFVKEVCEKRGVKASIVASEPTAPATTKKKRGE